LDPSDIEVVHGLEAVRRRPATFIDLESQHLGSYLVEQTLCTALDEAVSGLCQRIAVTLHPDGSVEVVDDGSGLPVTAGATGKTMAEVILTELLACRAQRQNADIAKRFCSGGMAVVNALSEWLRLEIRRDGKLWVQDYQTGIARAPFSPLGSAERTGTSIRFKPDATVLGPHYDGRFDAPDLQQRLSSLAAELPSTQLALYDLR